MGVNWVGIVLFVMVVWFGGVVVLFSVLVV